MQTKNPREIVDAKERLVGSILGVGNVNGISIRTDSEGNSYILIMHEDDSDLQDRATTFEGFELRHQTIGAIRIQPL